MTEHDIPRPQLVREHVEEYIWQLMCMIQSTDAPTRRPTPHLFALWVDTPTFAGPRTKVSVRNNYLENFNDSL